MEYSIGKFSKLTNLGIHTLRYYEHEGLITSERNTSNRRCYSDKDLTWIEFIKRLKDTRMPIKEIRSYVTLSSDKFIKFFIVIMQFFLYTLIIRRFVRS